MSQYKTDNFLVVGTLVLVLLGMITYAFFSVYSNKKVHEVFSESNYPVITGGDIRAEFEKLYE